MPRTLKPQKVGEVRHDKTRMVVDIMLDRNKLDFFAKVGTEEIREDTAPKCKEAVLEKMASMVQYKWEPMIIVRHDNHRPDPKERWRSHSDDARYTRAQVEFKFRRLERSPSPSGKGFVERKHILDVNASDEYEMKRREEEQDVQNFAMWEMEFEIVPYTEETWNGLMRLHASIERANDQLTVLLGAKDKLAETLMKMGQGFIPPQLTAVGEKP